MAPTLPPFTTDGDLHYHPARILKRRSISSKGRDTQQVLVAWDGLPETEPTKEDYDPFQDTFHPEDKVGLAGGGHDSNQPTRPAAEQAERPRTRAWARKHESTCKEKATAKVASLGHEPAAAYARASATDVARPSQGPASTQAGAAESEDGQSRPRPSGHSRELATARPRVGGSLGQRSGQQPEPGRRQSIGRPSG